MLRVGYFKYRLKASPRGRQILEVLEQFGPEIYRLANYNRQVTVVWNKNYGPAFILKGLVDGRKQDLYIVREVGGIKIEDMLRRMAVALQENGSQELREAVAKYAFLILRFVKQYDLISDFLAELDAEIETSENHQMNP